MILVHGHDVPLVSYAISFFHVDCTFIIQLGGFGLPFFSMGGFIILIDLISIFLLPRFDSEYGNILNKYIALMIFCSMVISLPGI